MKLVVLIFAFAVCILAKGDHGGSHGKTYAHFWTGGDSDTNPDALVTVDYTAGSNQFGQVISVAKVQASSTRKLHGNAPHHIGQSGDGRWIVAGGLLSFFVNVPIGEINGGNRDDVFLFRVGEDQKPVFHSTYNLPGGCTDEFHSISDNSWIVSQMCDDAGNSPGGLYKFTVPACGTFKKSTDPVCFASWSNWITSGESTLTDFNPHGGEWHHEKGFIISDFVWPASLLNSFTKGYLATIGDNVSPLTFRGTVRHFDKNGKYLQTIHTPKAPFTYNGNLGSFTIDVDIGLMQSKFFPRTGGRYAFVSGTFLNYHLFLIDLNCASTDSKCQQVTPVYDWSADFPGTILSVGIPHVDGEHSAILATVGMKHLGLIGYKLDKNNKPTNFQKRAGIDFGTVNDGATPQWPTSGYPGSHYLSVVPGRNGGRTRAIVINSFVDFPVNQGYVCNDLLACPTTDQAPGFMYNFHGGRSAASVWVNNDWTSLTLDSSFNPNLGGRTPHSVTVTTD